MVTLSFLIPVYNSEKTIGLLCESLFREFASQAKIEIVLVNDCSQDNSAEICKKLAIDNSDKITYIELSRNFGEHNALMAGFPYVSGDYCIVIDDDLQNPPEEVRKLYKEAQKGFDVVYSQYNSKKHSFFRNVGSSFNNWMAGIILQKPTNLYLSSFKIINRFLIEEIVKYDGPDPYIDGIILRSTQRIGTVIVEHRSRAIEKSGYTLKKLISLWGSMVLHFSMIPLRIIGFIGFAVSIWSLLYWNYRYFLDEPYGVVTEHQTLLFLMSFLFGLLFLCMALTAEYIGRIFLYQNREPQYIIRTKLLRISHHNPAAPTSSESPGHPSQ